MDWHRDRHVLMSAAPLRSLRRWPLSILALTLCTLLLCYGIAIQRGNTMPVAFDYLYGRETAFGDSYQWAPPRMQIFVPLELAAPAITVSHRLSAGPDMRATRALTITSAGITTRFALSGGTPARIYSYLLPTNGQVLAADYAIAPLPQTGSGEQRDLGFVVYATPKALFRTMHGSAWPALPLLAIVLIVPLSLLVMQLWGLRRYRRRSAGLLAALLIALYLLRPAATLIPSLAMGRGLLVLLICGGIGRLVLRRRSPYSLLLALCIATVTVPLIYAGNGLWLNLGAQWSSLRAVLLTLLVIPPAVGLAMSHPAAGRYAPWGAGLAVISVCAFGAWNLWEALTARPYDFTLYWEAAQRLRQGLPIYEVGRLTQAPFDVYKYHPVFLAFILPLSSWPLATSALLWKAVNLVAMIAGGIIILQRYRHKGLLPGIIFVVLLLNLSPITQSLRLGQIDGLLLLGLALVLGGSGERSPWLNGALWGLMSIIKVYPAMLALPDLLKYRRRLVRFGGLSIAGIVVFSGARSGWAQEYTFWQAVVPSLGARTTRLSNQSLYGLIGRTLYPASIASGNQATQLPLASGLHALLAAFILGVTCWLVWRQQCRQDSPEANLGAMSVLICAVLLSIPVSWDHYQAMLVLPLLAASMVVLQHNVQGPWLHGAYTLLAFGTYKQVQNGLIDGEVVLFLASYRTIGLLLLWGWWVWWLWRGQAPIERR
ncbi:MAG: DUF2029 domain-containing protein [Chloroflexales bacterium]|nr:DUF2029 domain-containing protein [Chloroflexales bacterium]